MVRRAAGPPAAGEPAGAAGRAARRPFRQLPAEYSCVGAPPPLRHITHAVRLGPALPGVEIACAEEAWPVLEHGADLVLLQHALDFAVSPHRLLREAARCVRPGGLSADRRRSTPGACGGCATGWPPTPWPRRAASLRRAWPTGCTCWASRWRNAGFGCYRPPLSFAGAGRRGWALSSPGPTAGSYRAAASICWWRASWSSGLRPLPRPRRATLAPLLRGARGQGQPAHPRQLKQLMSEQGRDLYRWRLQGQSRPRWLGRLLVYKGARRSCGAASPTPPTTAWS